MPAPLHVVAGVIRDVRGRVLLARRTRGRDMAGLWEFPGGKVDAGETAPDALRRELQEELGIEVVPGGMLMQVPQAMPHKRIVLDVLHIEGWRGVPRGLEGQALAWVPPERLPKYPMPPADRPVVAALLAPDHCLVTPSPEGMEDGDWLAGLERALEAGVRRVQLRAPGCRPGRWRTLVAEAVARCRVHRAEVLVNGDESLAERFEIGLHLPAAQLATRDARGLPSTRLLSAACHDADALQRAEAIGCDFALLGNVRETATHPGRPGIGWAGFAALRETCSLPIYAIGGLGRDDIAAARRHGAQGIAAIRGLWPAA